MSSRPQFIVVAPQLQVPEGGGLPHVFDGDQLCLCYPWQWDSGQLIAKTLIPWASEWLLHYEFWNVTGEWRGGGHEAIRRVGR